MSRLSLIILATAFASFVKAEPNNDNDTSSVSPAAELQLLSPTDLCAWCRAILTVIKDRERSNRDSLKTELALSCTNLADASMVNFCQRNVSVDAAFEKIASKGVTELCIEQNLCDKPEDNGYGAGALFVSHPPSVEPPPAGIQPIPPVALTTESNDNATVAEAINESEQEAGSRRVANFSSEELTFNATVLA